MIIAVGSKNPVKIGAVKSIFVHDDIISLDIGTGPCTGIAVQPFTFSQTVHGADRRAKMAFDSTNNARYGIGLESGFVQHVHNLVFNGLVCSIYDGRKFYTGMSSCFVVPSKATVHQTGLI